MALSGKTGRQTPIPHEPGEWLALRPLSFVDLRDAQERKSAAALRSISGVDAAMLRELQAAAAGAPKAASTPMDTYDTETVLRRGVVGWSYPEPYTADAVADLDPVTAAWAAGELLADLAPSEADRKNAVGGSTSTSTGSQEPPRPMNGS